MEDNKSLFLTNTYKVLKKHKKTKAKFFENVEAGDILVFTTEVKNITPWRRLYAPMVKVTYSDFDTIGTTKSFTELSNILLNFELEEYNV